jgi:hypothetical protein
VVLEAVLNNGLAFLYAESELGDDIDSVMGTINQNYDAL